MTANIDFGSFSLLGLSCHLLIHWECGKILLQWMLVESFEFVFLPLELLFFFSLFFFLFWALCDPFWITCVKYHVARNHFCIWANWYRKDIYHGGCQVSPRTAWNNPKLLCSYLWTHCKDGWWYKVSEYMLQVILILRLICFQQGQFVSTYHKSTCFNPGQFVADTKHRSPVVVLPIQKQS